MVASSGTAIPHTVGPATVAAMASRAAAVPRTMEHSRNKRPFAFTKSHPPTLAPELVVLAALDATLATAAYQLMAEHPDLGPNQKATICTSDLRVRKSSSPPRKQLDLS